jgi:PII-like signaling protein
MKILDSRYKLMRIYLSGGETFGGKPTYKLIVEKCLELGISGATVYRGIYGYGASKTIRSTRTLALSSDLPVVVEVVDLEDKLKKVLPEIININPDALITLEAASVIYMSEKN